jgi:very-short-patch-repair endonuclease
MASPPSPVDAALAIRLRGGVLPIRLLQELGVARSAVAAAMATGSVTQVRRGWYAVRDAPSDVVRAVRVGGSLTGSSVARLHGLWLLDDAKLHVRVAGSAARLRSPDDPAMRLADTHGVCVHYRERPSGPHDLPARDSLPRSLAEMFTCGELLQALIALDSALNSGQLTTAGREELRSLVRVAHRPLVDAADAGCDSGLETIARLLLYSRRVRHQTQARIPGVGRVDLLIGDRLVVELDGTGFHIDPPEFEEDRRRGYELVMRGYLVMRLTYRMVMHDWERVRADLLAVIARGEHKWGSRAQAWPR